MLASMGTLWVDGPRVCPAQIEVDICRGPSSFSVGGVPEHAAQGTPERVREALLGSGFEYPGEEIRALFLPPSIRVSDLTPFQLPLATALLLASSQIELGRRPASAIAGGLAADGSARGVPDVWWMAEAAAVLPDLERLIVPAGNREEASQFEGIEVLYVESLRQVAALGPT